MASWCRPHPRGRGFPRSRSPATDVQRVTTHEREERLAKTRVDLARQRALVDEDEDNGQLRSTDVDLQHVDQVDVEAGLAGELLARLTERRTRHEQKKEGRDDGRSSPGRQSHPVTHRFPCRTKRLATAAAPPTRKRKDPECPEESEKHSGRDLDGKEHWSPPSSCLEHTMAAHAGQ
jgi:hypothetical protein